MQLKLIISIILHNASITNGIRNAWRKCTLIHKHSFHTDEYFALWTHSNIAVLNYVSPTLAYNYVKCLWGGGGGEMRAGGWLTNFSVPKDAPLPTRPESIHESIPSLPLTAVTPVDLCIKQRAAAPSSEPQSSSAHRVYRSFSMSDK